MNQTRQPGHHSSILRANSQADGPKKRTSFSDDVYSPVRRASGVSLAQSEEGSTNNNDVGGFLSKLARPRSKVNISSGSDGSISSANGTATTGTGGSINKSCACFDEEHIKRMKDVLDHTAWKVLIIFFTAIILFGGSLQQLCPKAADPYIDVIFIVTIVFLLIDIVMLCCVVPSYFIVKPTMQLRNSDDEFGCFCFALQFGSFLFWFDLISVLSFLWEISFIKGSAIVETHLYVNSFGVPLNIGPSHSFAFNVEIIFSIIFRITRAARLFRLDVIGILQTAIASLNDILHCRNDENNFKRRVSWFRRDKGINEERLMEMDAAAATIQRAWRSQNIIGFLHAAGAEHRSSKLLSDSHHSQYPNSMDSQEAETLRRKKKDRLLKIRLQNIRKEATENGSLPSFSKKEKRRRKKKSQIGTAMNEKTQARLAVGMIILILVTTFFTYVEVNTSNELTMVSIHNTLVLLGNETQSTFNQFGEDLTAAAKFSSMPSLCKYQFIGQNGNFSLNYCQEEVFEGLRSREMRRIKVCSMKGRMDKSCNGTVSSSLLASDGVAKKGAIVSLLFTIFLLLIWSIALILFIGPVTTLVVSPIERMIRLLSMLVNDPLGYSKTKKYRTFMNEDDERARNTIWTQEALNGMETVFLMSTILRIGKFDCARVSI